MTVENYPDAVCVADAVELSGFVCDLCGRVYDTIGESDNCEEQCERIFND